MNTQLIEQHWEGIGDSKADLIASFYARLFERHPRFQALFPDAMDHQMEKMLETLALVAEASDAPALICPHLLRVGARHGAHGLKPADFEDFIEVLIETIGRYNTKDWRPECERSWREALNSVVLPVLYEGLRGQAQSARAGPLFVGPSRYVDPAAVFRNRGLSCLRKLSAFKTHSY